MSGTLVAEDPEPDAEHAMAPRLRWVAPYLVTVTWGGPEEGSWFYDSGELVTDPALYAQLGVLPAAFLDDAGAGEHATRMGQRIGALNSGRPPKHCSSNLGVFEVHVLEAACLPLHIPDTTPRYE